MEREKTRQEEKKTEAASKRGRNIKREEGALGPRILT